MFSKVISFRDFGSDQTIVLTDYGFWDVESNDTNNKTYSYASGSSGKNYEVLDEDVFYNEHQHKLVHPTVELQDTDKIDQYDKIWTLNSDGLGYTCVDADGHDVRGY